MTTPIFNIFTYLLYRYRMSAAVAVTPPPRPPPPSVLRQQEVGGADHTSQQDGAQEGEERTIRRLSGELTQASETGEDSGSPP